MQCVRLGRGFKLRSGQEEAFCISEGFENQRGYPLDASGDPCMGELKGFRRSQGILRKARPGNALPLIIENYFLGRRGPKDTNVQRNERQAVAEDVSLLSWDIVHQNKISFCRIQVGVLRSF